MIYAHFNIMLYCILWKWVYVFIGVVFLLVCLNDVYCSIKTDRIINSMSGERLYMRGGLNLCICSRL